MGWAEALALLQPSRLRAAFGTGSDMKTFLYSLMRLIIGALIGYAIELYKSSEQERIRYVDEEVFISKSVLDLPALPGQKIDVCLNDAKIEHITGIKVSLSNFEDKDFSDLPVLVTIIPPEGRQIDLIAKDAYVGHSKSRDRVSEIKNVKAPLIDGAKKFGFKIHTLNRTRSFDDKAVLLFFLLGRIDPETVVGIDKAGLELRPYSYEHYTERRPVSSYAPVIISVLVLVVLSVCYFYFFFWYLFKYKKRKYVEKRASDINLLNDLVQAKFPDYTDRELGGRLLYELDRKKYTELSKIDKLLSIEPKERDYFSTHGSELTDGNAEQHTSADS